MFKLLIYFSLIFFPGNLSASGSPEATFSNNFLILNQSRIYLESKYGESTERSFTLVSQELVSENNELERLLEVEELALTNKRKTLSRLDFQNLAQVFDIKVEEIRLRQKNKSDKLLAELELSRATFYKLVSPLLKEFVTENGVLGVFDSALMIVGNNKFDISDIMIDLIDKNITDLPVFSLK
jgi:Skp family chaperone for outer membrane proteins